MTRPVLINLLAAMALLIVGGVKLATGPALLGAILIAFSVLCFSLAGLLALRPALTGNADA